MNWDTAVERIGKLKDSDHFTGWIIQRAAVDESFEVLEKLHVLSRAGEISSEIAAEHTEILQEWVEATYGAEVVAALHHTDPSGARVPGGLEILLDSKLQNLINELFFGEEEE